VTGHSLGGAVAIYAALDIKNLILKGQHEIILRVFENPRPGNKEFAKYFNS